MEHVEMFEAVENGLGTVLAGITFFLNLDEEPLHVFNGHGAILRILLE